MHVRTFARIYTDAALNPHTQLYRLNAHTQTRHFHARKTLLLLLMFIYNVSSRKTLPSDIPRRNRDFQLVNYAHYIRTLSHCGNFLETAGIITVDSTWIPQTPGTPRNNYDNNNNYIQIFKYIIIFSRVFAKNRIARISRMRAQWRCWEYFN